MHPWSDKFRNLGGTEGFHEAIRVGDYIFDNVRPEGWSVPEYETDMGGEDGFRFLIATGSKISKVPF
jgi:hypothetical protein